jgi:predicted amidohydrolase
MKCTIIQLCSQIKPEYNLEKINYFLKQAKLDGCKAAFLPEVFYSMSDATKPTPYLVEGENIHYQNIQKLAQDNQLYLIGGSAATKVEDKIVNRIYNFNPRGELINHYDKIHLFGLKLNKESNQNNLTISEADVYTPGSEYKMLMLDQWKIGLSLCFDMRFPKMYRYYSAQGCQLLTMASAFTIPTGKAHWESLLRARAIENQSYVIAAGQWGKHNEKIQTWGHSLVVDPWGEIILDLGEGEKQGYVDLDLELVQKVRSRIDVLGID